MDFKDYYKIMGLSAEASASDIKQAYRKLARKFHPDVSKEPDAGKRFQEVGEAYEILSNPQKKAEYDQIRALRAAGGGRRSTRAGARSGEDEASRQFSDFFESVFGAGRAGNGGFGSARDNSRGQSFSRRGKDHHHRITIQLEEAIKGVQRTLKLQMPTALQGHSPTSSKTLNVKIPAGVIPKQQIRLTGQGGPGFSGGPNGDLLLEIDIAPHPIFVIDDRDILLTLPVTPWEAALGAKLKVPTVTGSVNLTIPEGSVGGKKLRLKGRGLGSKPTGDLIVTLQVSLPAKHSDEAKAHYRKLAELETSFNPRKSLEKWL